MSDSKPYARGGPKSPFDSLEYWVFRWMMFILFLAAAYKLLDHELGVTQLLYRLSKVAFAFIEFL